MNGVGSSVVRTVVPVVVGALITLAARAGFNITDEMITPAITVVATGVYYWVARWLEVNVNPLIGRVLLSLGLSKKAPTYHTEQ